MEIIHTNSKETRRAPSGSKTTKKSSSLKIHADFSIFKGLGAFILRLLNKLFF